AIRPGTQPVATFTDPAGAEAVANYNAVINWGDGATSSGTITFAASSGVFSVQGSHTYAEEGIRVITIAVGNESAPPVAVTSTATIGDAMLTAIGQHLGGAEA